MKPFSRLLSHTGDTLATGRDKPFNSLYFYSYHVLIKIAHTHAHCQYKN